MKKYIFAAFLALAGCANYPRNDQAQVIVNTFPAGASITIAGISYESPANRIWDVGSISGQLPLTVTAHWVSGATATQKVILERGKIVSFTIYRPASQGADIDAQYAASLQAGKAASQDVLGMALRSYNDDNAARIKQQNQKTYSPIINCTSVPMGSIISTSCN